MLGKRVKVSGYCNVGKCEVDTVGFLIESSVEGLAVCYWTRPARRLLTTPQTTFSCLVAVPDAPGKWVSNLFADGIDLVQFEERRQ